ncbi:acyltransferase domain-containing protein, partial [Streptomyces sp. AC558_RSS880]|uniref:acyltransferase domain-containing protein n=1 Tax=Streptomyces sp. AC558_RSS880 TaxID=2823687 RepID=UPI0020B8C612
VGMAAGLLESSPVFAEWVERCEAALAAHVDWSLTAVLRSSDDVWLGRVDVVQPVLWAVMVSLAQLWRSFGVEPGAVVGHSQGEIAAACVSGALSLDDAAMVVALRSRAILALAGSGGMASLGVPVERASELIAGFGGRVSVAAVNGPASVTVAGEPDALDALLTDCETQGVWARRVPVDYASHSVQVEAIRERLLTELAGIEPQTPTVPFYSAVTAERVETAALDAEYWYSNLRQTVRFEETVRLLLAQGFDAFVETSAHPVLTTPVEGTIDAADASAVVLGTLRRGEGGQERFTAALAEAFVHGLTVDWTPILGEGDVHVDLPTYAFQHQRYWLRDVSVAGADDATGLGLTSEGHPLLGASVSLADGQGLLLTGRLSLSSHPWLRDHAVAGSVLLPGTAFVELAIRAGDSVGCGVLDELALETPLVLPEHGGVQVQVMVAAPDADGSRAVSVYSRPDDDTDREWARNADGRLIPEHTAPEHADAEEQVWPPADAQPIALDAFYADLAEAGYAYGPSFRGLRAAWRVADDVCAEVALPAEQRENANRFGLHPALLDAALQAAALTGIGADGAAVRLPFVWNGVRLRASGASSLRVRLSVNGGDTVTVDAADTTGRPVFSARGLTLRPVTADQLSRAADDTADSLFLLDWVPAPVSTTEQPQAAAGRTTVIDCTPLSPADTGLADSAARATADVLDRIQAWLADTGAADPGEAPSRLVVVTHGAVAAGPGDVVPDLVHAPVWGLVRTAQSEYPGRFVLVDTDDSPASAALLDAAAHSGEPQLALRAGQLLVPRLARSGGSAEALVAPGGEWRLGLSGSVSGSLEGLGLVVAPEVGEPLGGGQVRVAVRAAGLNFRDVLIALGMYPGAASMGGEGAGVVTGVGPGVSGLAVGDRVLGMFPSFGPVAVADHRMITKVPGGWSFEQAASVPVVFLTAYYGLVELGGLRAGESVLVHAGAGGVGMAAVQIARHLGAEVFATASEGKWETLRSLGLEDDHIADSRSLGFEERIRTVTGGRGVDVVLNSLAGEFVDASLRLLAEGGRFVEMGKTDVRDAGEVAAGFGGVSYRAFDLIEAAGADGVAELFAVLMPLFAAGALNPV